MKLLPLHAARPRQSGSAVVVVLALLTILLIYVGSNIRTLSSLGRELRLLEHQQTLRLQKVTATTNAAPAILTATNSPAR